MRSPESPDPIAGIVQFVVRIGGSRFKSGLIDLQALRFCLLQHPVERDIGETSLVVPATDVRVDASEPDLLDGLTPSEISRVIEPQTWRKVFAFLVDRQSVVAVFDIGVQRAATPTLAGVHHERRYGVPDADDVHGAAPTECVPESVRYFHVAFDVVELSGVRNQVVVAGR